MNKKKTNTLVKRIVQNARKAQEKFQYYSQEKVDRIVTAIAWSICNPKNNLMLSQLAVKSTRLGNVKDKIIKNQRKTLGLLRDLKNVKSTGVIFKDKKKGIIEIAKPIGIIGAITPSTNPIATPINNIINAIKCKNSIILSPSPSGHKVLKKLISFLNKELSKIKAPKNLIQTFNVPITKEITHELMKQVDKIIVTGSQNNVREATVSGTPNIGVGVGNVTVIVDNNVNFKDVISKIKSSKIFDNATSCSSENNVIILKKSQKIFKKLISKNGGIILNNTQKQNLRKSLWSKGKLNRNLIGKSAKEILTLSNLNVKTNINSSEFIVVNEKGVGNKYPFSGEKLSPIMSLYVAKDFSNAKLIAKKILNFQGAGHSIGIHSKDKKKILDLGLNFPVCRVIVNQAHTFATGGSFTNGLPFSLSMGCGTWQKNSIDENLNYRHFMNITKISRPIKGKEPKLKEFFKNYLKS